MECHKDMMERTVLRTAIESLAFLAMLGILGNSLPFALAINGLLDLRIALLWALAVNISGVTIWSRYNNKFKVLPLGAREAWFFTVTVFFGIIGVGVSLMTLSTFGAPTIS